MRQDTGTIQSTLRREGINIPIFRKGSEKLEQQFKKKGKGKKWKANNMECEKFYIGETKFTIRKRMEHMKDAKFRRTSNTKAKRAEECGHQID